MISRMSKTARVPSRTVASLLTPGGRGAVATIRYSGEVRRIDDADPPIFRAANGRPLSEQPLGRIVFGHWGPGPVEETVVCRVADTELEIHCHGGDAAVSRILEDLRRAGTEIVAWREFVAREEGTLAAEFVQALATATTLRTAEILLEQQSGVLRNALGKLLTAQAVHDGLAAVDALLRWSNFGLHLSRPWSVVLAGRPNVGKSSLINALVGYSRSIVYDQPGTTRDVVTAQTALQGWPIEFADTAGIRRGSEELEAAGIERARERLARADLIVLLIDTSRPPDDEDWQLLSAHAEALVVAHKADRTSAWGDQLPRVALPVSSLTGEGVQELATAIISRLIPEEPRPGTAVPFTARQIEQLQRARAALTNEGLERFRESVSTCLA